MGVINARARPKRTRVLPPPRSQGIRYSSDLVTVGTESRKVLEAAPRKQLMIQNLTASAIYVAFGTHARTSDHKIIAGGSFTPENPPNNAIYLIGDAADLQINITEGL